MSRRRRLLEQQYLDSLRNTKTEKKKGEIYANPLVAKVCTACGSKVSPVYSPDFGQHWYCYGHRPGVSQEEYDKQTEKTKIMEEWVARRAAQKEDKPLPGRKSQAPRPVYEPIKPEEEGVWW